MNDIRISIIIPAYNEERYLDACLRSISEQTAAPYEVIVVDNNSTDATVAVAARYPFVKVITASVQGLVFARDAGFNAATGDILARIDADTRLSTDWTKTLTALTYEWPAFAAFTGPGEFYDGPLPRFAGALQAATFQFLQWPAMRGATLWGSNMAIRRQAWHTVRASCHLRADIDEDIDLTLQLRKHNLAVRYSTKLQASMSLLRGKLRPIDTALYLSTWPRDYTVNGRPIAAVYIGLVMALTVFVSIFVWVFICVWSMLKSR